MLAVLIEGGSADHLDLTTGQCRLQDICRIHGTFGISRANQIMDLINDQNDIAALFDFTDQALHTAFKLATELCTGHQCGQIQQKYFFIP